MDWEPILYGSEISAPHFYVASGGMDFEKRASELVNIKSSIDQYLKYFSDCKDEFDRSLHLRDILFITKVINART